MMIRKFVVSAYMGFGNSIHNKTTIECSTVHEAAKRFAAIHEGTVYSVRVERPFTENNILHSMWSASWSQSGQRIYIRESIGTA